MSIELFCYKFRVFIMYHLSLLMGSVQLYLHVYIWTYHWIVIVFMLDPFNKLQYDFCIIFSSEFLLLA
jgi:hypothetical protein